MSTNTLNSYTVGGDPSKLMSFFKDDPRSIYLECRYYHIYECDWLKRHCPRCKFSRLDQHLDLSFVPAPGPLLGLQ